MKAIKDYLDGFFYDTKLDLMIILGFSQYMLIALSFSQIYIHRLWLQPNLYSLPLASAKFIFIAIGFSQWIFKLTR